MCSSEKTVLTAGFVALYEYRESGMHLSDLEKTDISEFRVLRNFVCFRFLKLLTKELDN